MTYGCHNHAARSDTLEVQDGWREDTTHGHPSRRPKMTVIPDPMTKDCQYTHTDLGMTDAKCDGCRHRAPFF